MQQDKETIEILRHSSEDSDGESGVKQSIESNNQLGSSFREHDSNFGSIKITRPAYNEEIIGYEASLTAKRDSKGGHRYSGQGYKEGLTSQQQAANRYVEDMMARSTKAIRKNTNKDLKTKKSQSLAKEKGYEPKFDKRSLSCNNTPTILTGSSFGKKLLMNDQRANKFLENGVEKDWMNNNTVPQLDVTKIIS